LFAKKKASVFLAGRSKKEKGNFSVSFSFIALFSTVLSLHCIKDFRNLLIVTTMLIRLVSVFSKENITICIDMHYVMT
jgi:uncharacterized Tic20 family protein